MEAWRVDHNTIAGAARFRCERKRRREPPVASQAFQSAGILQLVSQYVGWPGQKGSLLHL